MLITPEHYMAQLTAVSGCQYTEEQKQVILNFNKSCLVKADPGTGKTQTVIAGLIAARQLFKMNAEKICAMSFTKAATNEMEARFTRLCKKLGISLKIQFRTFHSFAFTICSEHYMELGMRKEPSIQDISHRDLVKNLEAIAGDHNIVLDSNQFRDLAKAISSLNSSLTFDKFNIERKMSFQTINISYELFTFFRSKVFRNNIRSNKIPRGEICMFALAILLLNPEISESFKERYQILVVDEAQDMSLLLMKFLSLICKELIIVGDIKQQIYYWNGASARIFEEYKELYTDSNEFELTQSFRCGKKIAEYSKNIIKKNNDGGEKFTGSDKNEEVNIVRNFDLEELISKFKTEMKLNNNIIPREMMFLYRNNFSAIPLLDLLYKYEIPAIVPKYIRATDLPVIKDLVELIQFALNPEDIDKGEVLTRIIPEFNGYKGKLNPIQSIAKKTGESMLSVNFRFKNGDATRLMSDLLEAREKNLDKCTAGALFNVIYHSYYNLYLEYNQRYLDKEPSYYINMVKPLLGDRSFEDFLLIENAKEYEMIKSTNKGYGVMCYTFHGAKGTEADVVTLIDAEEGLLPDSKRLQRMIDKGCEEEAYNYLRNERCLAFVACTRAKSVLNITYTNDMAKIIEGRSTFDYLDSLKHVVSNNQSDIQEFMSFCKEIISSKA